MPVQITCGLIKNAMHAHGWATRKFLVDGFPRNEDNYSGWNEVMGDAIELAGVLHFDCDEDTLIARVLQRSQSSGRTDDNIDTLRRRLAQYREQQLPIVQRFEQQGKVIPINGLQSVDAVFEEIKKGIANYL